ncbi:SH3 and multiple ankyrin repeat domains protein 3-like [Physeter macrocephalus]|uniref:SH3 and multiple ankyrin repeat domains protein 3-like n=1 Tax=Physeter macrocephalus TaxID=9755 RepID=A0A9W2WQ97_PHYMC|nr:SH3 and multiple ankyrin repeat domains protein 3-like [Physeter catodon]
MYITHVGAAAVRCPVRGGRVSWVCYCLTPALHVPPLCVGVNAASCLSQTSWTRSVLCCHQPVPRLSQPCSQPRLFSSLGELSSISAQRSPGGPGGGASYPVRPGGRYPVARRAPSPVKPASLERVEGLGAGAGGAGRPFGLTPPTILKSSSLSIPHEPKEVRFVVRSVSARSRSPSPSPLPSPAPGPGPGAPSPRRPFQQKPLQLWSKFDVGDWLESIHLGEHRDRFEDHEIEGAHLPALTKDDFVELGVTRVGHRMNIERALRQLDGS